MSNKLPASAVARNRTNLQAKTRARLANAVPESGTLDGDLNLGMLPGLLGYQLRLAQRAIFADFAETMAELEVSPGLFGMLVIIEANPGLKQTKLAEAAHLDRSSLVPALDKLEARGWVTRRASEQDRRINGLWLTADGMALLKRLKQKVARHEERLVSNLSASERDQLFGLLARILPEKR
jgi:DNA-binding MarR family transcriptional regulator